MSGGDGYLSKDRVHLALLQRERRARMVRIDYMPGREALAILETRRARERPNSLAGTNSAVLDAILQEWASLTGLNNQCLERPMTSEAKPEFSYRSAHARMSSEPLPDWMLRTMARAENRKKQAARVTCAARRHRDGQP